MPRLLLATNNPHKVAEIVALLAPTGWTLITPAQAAIQLDPEETATTYTGNATIKARAFAAAAGLPALSDDSGLEVDALDGRPGVASARYGGADLPHDQKIRLLLDELRAVPAEHRSARFRCSVVIAAPDGRTWETEGTCEGVIATEPKGSTGFGYDPIFYMPEHQATMAELGDELKNRLSHRAKAVQAAAALLESLRDDPTFR